MLSSRRWAVLGLALVACGTIRPALTGPERGGPAWRELTTPHFVLLTDLSEEAARAEIAELERMERIFIVLSPGTAVPAPTRVLVFARQVDFNAISPTETTVGFFAGDDRHPGSPIIVLFGSFEEPTRRVLQHELTHRFVAQQIPNPPVWLNEGLAKYFETMSFKFGKLEIGLADWHFYPGPYPPRVEPVPIEDLLEAGYGEFHGPREWEYYSTAWAFVHMLRAKRPGYSTHFSEYIHALQSGLDRKEAWRTSFGDVSLHDLQVSFNNYVTSPYVNPLSGNYVPPPTPSPVVHMLTGAEVGALYRNLRAARKAAAGR